MVLDGFQSGGRDQGQGAEGESVAIGGGDERTADSEGPVEEGRALGVV